MSRRHKRPRPITAAQRAAARANGARSHGPVTAEGKATSARNAVRHGLAVSSLVLNNEDREKFNALIDSYIDEYQPATKTEMDLVEQMTASKWLLERCWTLEAATLDFSLEKMRLEVDSQVIKTDEAMRSALAFERSVDESNAFTQLNRYAARHSREWHRNLDKLRTIQKERYSQHQTAHEVSGKQELPNEPEPLIPSQHQTAHEVSGSQAQQTPAHEVSGKDVSSKQELPNEPEPSAQNPERERGDSAAASTQNPELQRRENTFLRNEPVEGLTPVPPALYDPPRAPEVLVIR